jgi:cysteine desulfurase
LNLSFAGVDAESMLNGLKDIAMSAGSACRTEEIEPSYVLKAIGVKRELALSTLRFGIGRFTAQDEVDHVIGRVVETVRKLRALRK